MHFSFQDYVLDTTSKTHLTAEEAGLAITAAGFFQLFNFHSKIEDWTANNPYSLKTIDCLPRHESLYADMLSFAKVNTVRHVELDGATSRPSKIYFSIKSPNDLAAFYERLVQSGVIEKVKTTVSLLPQQGEELVWKGFRTLGIADFEEGSLKYMAEEIRWRAKQSERPLRIIQVSPEFMSNLKQALGS